nr:MAG TPA: hypothetical protein [Caudoviricetes sp.]
MVTRGAAVRRGMAALIWKRWTMRPFTCPPTRARAFPAR